MTYKFNKETHSTKVKAGMQAAKQAGKKLGRPKGGKIKGEDEVIRIYMKSRGHVERPYRIPSRDGDDGFATISCIDWSKTHTYTQIAQEVGVSIGTVQRIINKYKLSKTDKSQ